MAQPSLSRCARTQSSGGLWPLAGGTVAEAGAVGAESLFCQLLCSGGSGSPITLSLGDQSVTRYTILDPEYFQHPLTHGLHPDS